MATDPKDAGPTGLAGGTEDMDTSRSGLLTSDARSTPDTRLASDARRRVAARHYHAAPPGSGCQPATEPAAACVLAPGLTSVGIGRRFTAAALARWGLTGLCDQAELVVSELVTNAIQHGLISTRQTRNEYPVGLRLLVRAPFVTCLVTDPGSRMPACGAAGPDAESGRGLSVVEACSIRWGWRPLQAGGKVVWALLREG